MKRNRIYALLIALFLLPVGMSAVTLTLEHTIELANDSSLMAFRYRNMYQAGYWQYVSYRAGDCQACRCHFCRRSITDT